MTEELLDHAEVGASIKQVRCERVAQRMWRNPDREAGETVQAIDAETKAPDADRLASLIEEDLDRIGARASAEREEDTPALVEVGGQGPTSWAAKEPDTLLSPLAEDPDLAASEVERGDVGACELADPESGRVGRLDHGAVPECEGDADPRVVLFGRHEFGVDRHDQPIDLLDFEDPREPARLAWRGDRSPRITGCEAVTSGETMERANGSEALGHR